MDYSKCDIVSYWLLSINQKIKELKRFNVKIYENQAMSGYSEVFHSHPECTPLASHEHKATIIVEILHCYVIMLFDNNVGKYLWRDCYHDEAKSKNVIGRCCSIIKG